MNANGLERSLGNSLAQLIGNTPLVRIGRLDPRATACGNIVLGKLEGNNPGGSVKDRPALWMIQQAMVRGQITAGDRLIEATSGNTGIALAMVAASIGLKMTLIMPDNMSLERRQSMAAYGAQLILVPKAQGMERARDLAQEMAARGEGVVLDQFSNSDNPTAHFATTGPEIWRDTAGKITHFVSSMGTTGTIIGTGRFLKQQNPVIQIIGVQPADGAQIPGIRRWPTAYLPKIYDPRVVDRIIDVDQALAEETTRRLAREEGILAGISSGGAMAVALQVAAENENAVIVSIVCDRGDRYLSTGVFPAG
ncbi:MAG TPA: cysteine synthase CysM [Halothiobacillus sp.]|nr:MAG: cysteine synthase B [Halothiobacillus sp. 20-54-6]HQT42712.1 cysteine synthase CysM [Halothiobacillus sp.]